MTAAPPPRGACPSLSAPMQTGDGLLVRLNPRHGALSPAQASGVAHAAGRFGNGILEITARGSLQVRGLVPRSAPRFADAVAALGIEAAEGVEVRTGALAGLDAAEIADPRPLAEEIRAGIEAGGLAGKLAAKTSVTVDGGGALPLRALVADVKLEAVPTAGAALWSLRAGRSMLGCGDGREACAGALAVLELLARNGKARGRDLSPAECAPIAARLRPWAAEGTQASPDPPVGSFPLRNGGMAQGFGTAFGQVEAGNLARFCCTLEERVELRLAAGRSLIVVGRADADLAAAAEKSGFVASAGDVRLRIAACAGAPGCASAWFDTKRVAADVSARGAGFLRAVPALHLSGCPKGCARPAGPALSLIGTGSGAEFVCEGAPCDPQLAKLLKALAERTARRPEVPA